MKPTPAVILTTTALPKTNDAVCASSEQNKQTILTRKELRAQVRNARRALSSEAQIEFALQASTFALNVIQKRGAKRVALYLTNDGELDTEPLIKALWQKGVEVYLPRLHPFTAGNLIFLAYTPNSTMTKNSLGIWEPKLDIREMRCTCEIDLIITPLVAFDNEGNRMGMGGGFYDRTLANWQTSGRPLPVGYAHDCQRVERLPTQHWDVPLPIIVTPSGVLSI
ncbi:5-formyltetrahydrofolate cyclo-ligase [Shewanella psychrotolerans]|uniref:5-formyltetrahydrofolate cyclo-ligase n=1 Tax=Shewanella psychrotolerans TaxID=2864206 RepID=UPI003D9C8BE7